jgi:hypothetical protein
MADFVPLFGYAPDRVGTDAFLASLAKPTLAQAGPDLALDEGRDVFLGSALLKCDPSWKRGSQKIGSCVGWGWALSCDILAACDIHVRNEAETYGGRVLEASVYAFSRVEVRGSRNLGGDGSYGGAAAKAVTKYGTLHYGQDYGGQRFTDNSGTREKEWGRDGVPDSLEKYAAQHKVSSVALVKTFEEAAKAIQNGYPVAVCSMQGFSMTLRDGGYLSPMGQWAHCMMFAGVRWKPHPALLCVNSWGDCYSGDVDATLPVQFQRSAGYVRAETCTRMLAGEDSFALSGYSGFAPRTMPGNWLEGIL